MAMENEEMVELISPAAPQPKRRTWVGLAVIAVGAVGVVGWTQSKNQVSRLSQLSAMHKGLMRAFSARAMGALPDTKVKFDLLLNQVGEPEPSAMTVSAEISQSKDEHKWPELTKTFKAKEGKQADLKAQFEEIIAAVLKDAAEAGNGPAMEDLITVTEGEAADTVDIHMKLPKGDMEKEADHMLGDGLKEAKPSFHAALKFGRGLQEIFDHSDDNVLTLTKGLQVSIDTQFASLMYDAAGPMMGPNPAFDVLKGFASFGTSFSFLYKDQEETEEAFGMVPSLKQEMDQFKEEFAGEMPESIQGPMKGLDEVADGLLQVKLTGLPENYQIVADFENCHLAPLIKAMVEEFHPADELADEPADEPAEEPLEEERKLVAQTRR